MQSEPSSKFTVKPQPLLVHGAFAPLANAETAARCSDTGGSRLIQALTTHSRDIADISEDFLQVVSNYKIKSVYEQQNWRDTGSPIVDEQSARLFIENEQAVGIDADHVGMCQFSDEDDEGFLLTLGFIREALKTGGAIQPVQL